MFKQALSRDLLISVRNPQAIAQPFLLYFFVVCLFPIALGADNDSLNKIAPAALWIPLLLATLLAGEQFFNDDFQNSLLSQDVLHCEMWQIVGAKICGAWLRLVFPLLLSLPLLALLLHFPLHTLPAVALLLVLGSTSLLLLSSIGAALTLGKGSATFLRFLIVLPLYLPILILGVNAVNDRFLGLNIFPYYALLGALALFFTLCALPFSALAIKSQALH